MPSPSARCGGIVVGHIKSMDAFSHSGAACRCLLRLVARSGTPMSEGEFIARFRPQFELWDDHPGMTDTAMVCDIARSLGLAKSVQVLRRYVRVVQCFTNPKVVGVLTFTERFRNPEGHLVPRYDCSVVEEMDAGRFKLWTPLQDGLTSTEEFPERDWDVLCAHALILA